MIAFRVICSLLVQTDPSSWTPISIVRVEETAGIARDGEIIAVKADLKEGFPRVVSVRDGREVPSQNGAGSEVVFLASLPENGARTYRISSAPESSGLETGLVTAPVQGFVEVRPLRPFGLTVSNGHLRVDLHPRSGQIGKMAHLKGSGKLLTFVGGDRDSKIHWNPDLRNRSRLFKAPGLRGDRGWEYVHYWDPPPHFELEKGPVRVRLRRWGPFTHNREVFCSVTYTIPAGQPYLIVDTELKMLEDYEVEFLRDDEFGFKFGFNRALWKEKNGTVRGWDLLKMIKPGDTVHGTPIVQHGIIPLEPDLPWITFYNDENAVAVAVIHLEYRNGAVGRVEMAAPMSFIHVKGKAYNYWGRFLAGMLHKLPQVRLPKGCEWRTRSAILFHRFDGKGKPEELEKYERLLRNPLRVTVTPVAGKPRFTDVTKESGIRLNTKTRPRQPQYGTQRPHGVAIEDFDEDGLADILFVCFGEPHVQLFRNLGGLRFKNVTKGSGLETFTGWGTGAAVGDYDRDGHLDVYLTSVQFDKKDRKITPAGRESRLYKGTGKGTFRDVSEPSGTLLRRPGRSCAWSDVDGDGWIDLYVTGPFAAAALFKNNRDGTFTDIAAEAGVALADRTSLGCAFGDIDGDGLDDLFVANYYSQVSVLFRNQGGGRFRDITGAAGVGRKASGVGCVFADVSNRGKLDLYVTTDSWLSGANYTEAQLLAKGNTVEPNVLYRGDGKAGFAAAPDGTLAHKTLSHDAILEDLDHDGFVEIYVGVDAIPTGNKFATSKGGNPLWTRPDGKTWREARAEWGVGFEANCVCVPAADLDNDGDLDLVLVNFYKNAVIYRNDTDDRNWLRVKAVGRKSNLDGIGAKIRVFAPDGKLVGFREVQSGAGYGRSSPLEAHFGLGKKPAAAYRVEVVFPAAKKTATVSDAKPGRRIVIREPE